MYVTNTGNNTISQINLSTGAIVNANFGAVLNNPSLLAIDPTNTFMYVTNSGNSTISQINLSTGAIANANWTTGTSLNSPTGLVINGSYMYVTNNGNTTISQIDLSTGAVLNATWATGLNSPKSLAITGSYMYVTNSNTISQLFSTINNSIVLNSNWSAGGLNNPTGIVIDSIGKYMYVSDSGNNRIIVFNLQSPPTTVIYNQLVSLSATSQIEETQQRNANCLLQSSQINGGNISQFFNLQGLKIVKCYAVLVPYPATTQTIFLTDYDKSPVQLGVGDCIISASIQSKVTGNSSVSVSICFTGQPVGYNTDIDMWTPNSQIGFNISGTNSTISLAQLNNGNNISLGNVYFPYAYNNWLTCVINNPTLITTVNPLVNLVLLILNPTNPI
jgi:DNA-binding beta-propeller fold protein YncE